LFRLLYIILKQALPPYICKNNQIMSAIYLLIGVSFLIALGFLMAFFFAIKTGQYDDTHTPSIRMLFDDEQNES